MKIQKITEDIKRKFVELDFYANVNSAIETEITYPIETNFIYPTDPEQIKETAEQVLEEARKKNADLTQKDALRTASFAGGVAGMCAKIFENDSTLSEYLAPLEAEFRLFGESDLGMDPYFSAVNPPGFTKGAYTLSYETFHPYQLAVYDESAVMKNRPVNIPRICAVDYAYTYPIISKNDKVICALTPNVLFVGQKLIKDVSGDVLLLGSELGYLAYSLSLKDNVKSITVVEGDKNILSIFEEKLLPLMGTEKIKTAECNPIEFLSKTKDGEFDCVVASCFMSLAETNIYTRVKKEEQRFKNTKFFIRDETAFLMHLMSFTIRRLEEAYYLALGYDPSQIPLLAEDDEKKAKYIDKLTKNIVITSSEDIDNLTKLENLKTLIESSPYKI